MGTFFRHLIELVSPELIQFLEKSGIITRSQGNRNYFQIRILQKYSNH